MPRDVSASFVSTGEFARLTHLTPKAIRLYGRVGLLPPAGSRKLLIRHVQAILTEGDDPMFSIETRCVPSRRVMSIQRRVRADETDSFGEEDPICDVAFPLADL